FLCGVFLQDFVWQIERRVVANNPDGKLDLPVRLRERLALFQGQQPREFVLSRFQRISQLTQQRTALRNRLGGPHRERRLRGGNRLVELPAISSRHLRQHVLGRWVDD